MIAVAAACLPIFFLDGRIARWEGALFLGYYVAYTLYVILDATESVEFVRDQLVAAGIHPSRIQVTAHGEAPAQDASADSYALERRVSMTLFIGDEGVQPVARTVEP